MLQFLTAFVGRVLRALIGLVMVVAALGLGAIVATGVLLRMAWLGSRQRRVPSPSAPRARAPRGEVIDVEVREVRAR